MTSDAVGAESIPDRIKAAVRAGGVTALRVFGAWIVALLVYGVVLDVICVSIAGQGSRFGAVLTGIAVLIGSLATGIYVSAQQAIGRGAAAAIEAGALCSTILNTVAQRLPSFAPGERLEAKREIVVAKMRELTNEVTSSSGAGLKGRLRKSLLTRIVNRMTPKIRALDDVALTPQTPRDGPREPPRPHDGSGDQHHGVPAVDRDRLGLHRRRTDVGVDPVPPLAADAAVPGFHMAAANWPYVATCSLAPPIGCDDDELE